jgi:hypothetical protein
MHVSWQKADELVMRQFAGKIKRKECAVSCAVVVTLGDHEINGLNSLKYYNNRNISLYIIPCI